jgi:hypothetical protein
MGRKGELDEKAYDVLAALSRKAVAPMKADSSANIRTVDYQKVNPRGELPLFHWRCMVTNQQKKKFWSSIGSRFLLLDVCLSLRC